MNKSDSERIATVLEKIGYRPASDIKKTDLITVNMCSVRQSAVDRVFGLKLKFNDLKRKNKKLKTILTGCILRKDLPKFKDFFDYILSIKTLPDWNKFLKKKKYFSLDLEKNGRYLNFEVKPKNNFRALVPVSNGCNNFCSYCVVPFTRGPLVCRNHREVLKETKKAVERGAKEVWLLGQNVNDYCSPTDVSVDFPELLKKADGIPGNFWIRFTSPNPKDFSEKLINAMANSEKITEYLNLPLQSGDNQILKKMRRAYTAEKYKNLVKKIRSKIPEISLSTDIIVGFPSESKSQFENTAKLFKEIKFDMAYISKYSPRPGTVAEKMKDNVLPVEKNKREKILTEILKKTALEKNKKYIGKTIEVLTENYKKYFLTGKTRTYKTVKFKGKKDSIGKFKKVRITDALPWGLKGNLCK